MDKKQYLKEFKKLRESIKQGEATWQDVMDIRDLYDMPLISKETLRKGCFIYDEFDSENWVREPVQEEEFDSNKLTELKSDGSIDSTSIISLNFKDINDKDKLLSAHGFNPDDYELISARTSKWQVSKKDGTRDLYSSKISVKPKIRLINDDLVKFLENFTPNYKDIKMIAKDERKETNQYLVICLFDVHFGRVSWAEETGETYNLEIARERVLQNIGKYLEKYKGKKFQKVVFVIGQDYFNSASNGFTSSNKHKQDNGDVFRAIFKKGTQTIIEAITLLKELGPLSVSLVEGNHGREEEFMMAQVVEAYFKDSEEITVDSSPTSRKYFMLGGSTVGFAHGSEERERLFGLMQIEVPGFWAVTTNHMWLTGHLHSLKVESKSGVDVWSIPALTGNDSWSEKKGYKPKKCSMGFIFDKSGLTDITFVDA